MTKTPVSKQVLTLSRADYAASIGAGDVWQNAYLYEQEHAPAKTVFAKVKLSASITVFKRLVRRAKGSPLREMM